MASRRRTAPSNGKKSLPAEQNQRVQRLARDVVVGLGSTTRAAKALGVSQPYLSQVLSGAHGAGMTLLDGLARYTGKSLDEIRTGCSNVQSFGGTGGTMATWMARVPAGGLPGWPQAEERARSENPDVPAWAWDEARTLAAPRGATATADLAADLAFFAWRHLGVEIRAELEARAREAGSARLRAAPVQQGTKPIRTTPRRGDKLVQSRSDYDVVSGGADGRSGRARQRRCPLPRGDILAARPTNIG